MDSEPVTFSLPSKCFAPFWACQVQAQHLPRGAGTCACFTYEVLKGGFCRPGHPNRHHADPWVQQSVEAVLPDLPRWERHLRSRGIDAIPALPSRSWSAANSRAHNELVLLMMQAHKDRDSTAARTDGATTSNSKLAPGQGFEP